MTTFHAPAALLLAGCALTMVATPAIATGSPPAASGDTLYVQGSLVNLRFGPSVQAPVLRALPLNSTVKLLKSQDNWCLVTLIETPWPQPAYVGTGVAEWTGYTACHLLKNKAVTEQEVYAALSEPKLSAGQRIDLAARAFWLSPSMARWVALGRAYEQTLSWEARFKVNERPTAPEFEAALAHLGSGVVVVQSLVRPGKPRYAEAGSAQMLAARRLPLPEASSSFFKAGDFDAIVPTGLSSQMVNGSSAATESPWNWQNTGSETLIFDALSKRFNRALKLRVTGPAVTNRADEVEGVWKAGTVQIDYDRPVFVHGLETHGKIIRIAMSTAQYTLGGGECFRGAVEITQPLRSAGTPTLDNLLLAWVGRQPTQDGVKITSRSSHGRKEADRRVTHHVDLNNDGIADFVIYEGRHGPTITGEIGRWKLIYANVAGKWEPVDFDITDECP